MGYSFTSPKSPARLSGQTAKSRCESGSGLESQYRQAKQGESGGQNLLVNAGIRFLQCRSTKIMHDKVIIADGRNVEVGSLTTPRSR